VPHHSALAKSPWGKQQNIVSLNQPPKMVNEILAPVEFVRVGNLSNKASRLSWAIDFVIHNNINVALIQF